MIQIHCSCGTVMALLCIPLSELVSFAFSTIPICPFLHLLVYIASHQLLCLQHPKSQENCVSNTCTPTFHIPLCAPTSIKHMYVVYIKLM